MLEPSSSTSPLCQCLDTLSFMRLRERRKVVLPEPVGPIKAVISPLAMATFIPDRTVADPKPRDKSRASIDVATISTPTAFLPLSTVIFWPSTATVVSEGTWGGTAVLMSSVHK